MVFNTGMTGKLSHFALRLDRLEAAADYVAETIRQNYPTLAVPFHARWRHFMLHGEDRWETLTRGRPMDRNQRARTRFDVAVVSVLLDAGAGDPWRWKDPRSGAVLMRSEGLAIASIEAFAGGLFSSIAADPMRVDAAGLLAVTTEKLAGAFQVSADNPLEGLDGRAELLRRLGQALKDDPKSFGEQHPRVGNLFDRISQFACYDDVSAPQILRVLLDALGSVWQGRMALDNVDLGDTWRHPAIDLAGPTNGLIPFHKLSQWLTYSLIEPLWEAGLSVSELDGLTGLAEYRNGGLFVDLGVIEPKYPDLLEKIYDPADEPIVEWRALTVILLDEIAPLVRKRLGKSAEEMPLASILEGGTWSAGRRIARERRPGGGPPIRIVSDGSVF